MALVTPMSVGENRTCNLILTKFPLAFVDLKTLQTQDPELAEISRRIRNGESRALHCG